MNEKKKESEELWYPVIVECHLGKYTEIYLIRDVQSRMLLGHANSKTQLAFELNRIQDKALSNMAK